MGYDLVEFAVKSTLCCTDFSNMIPVVRVTFFFKDFGNINHE